MAYHEMASLRNNNVTYVQGDLERSGCKVRVELIREPDGRTPKTKNDSNNLTYYNTTQNQFYMRLMLIIAAGIVYVYAYMNMAKRNDKETPQKRHLVLKILGIIFAFIGILSGIMGLYFFSQIIFPQEAIEPYISPNMIVRPSYQTMYWGYPTMEQSQCLSLVSSAFEGLALSAYCLHFKSSNSKWYNKIGKIVFCVFYYLFYASATNFHYFDFYEWIAPALFLIMTFFAFQEKSEKAIKIIPKANSITINSSDTLSNIDQSTHIPSQINEIDIIKDANSDDSKDKLPKEFDKERNLVQEPSLEDSDIESSTFGTIMKPNSMSEKERNTHNPNHTIQYCRYCGGKVNYQSDKYCKHCGKLLK